MVRIVLGATAYRVHEIYDPDTGLTPSQIRAIVTGSLEDERRAFARDLQLWTAVAPMLAAATNYGFTGNPAALNDVTGRIRTASRDLVAAPVRETQTVHETVVEVAGAHPMFAANIGRALT